MSGVETVFELRERLGNGRQYGREIDQIKKNHVIRYEWAAAKVSGLEVVDAGCGIGYGSHILSQSAESVIGLEFDPGVVEFARENWKRNEKVSFQVADLCASDIPAADCYVALESIEHLIAPEIFLSKTPIGSHLIGSVPHETKRPLKRFSNPHHFQNYTTDQVEELLAKCGFVRQGEFHCQEYGPVMAGTDGLTILFTATKVMDHSFDRDELVRRLPTILMKELMDRSNHILLLKKKSQ